MDVINYIENAERQLNNKEHYCKLSKDQTAANHKTVNNVIYRKVSKGKSNSQKRSRKSQNYFTLETYILYST